MAQTPLDGPRLRTCCTTPPTDKLTIVLQLAVQQIHHIAMPESNISTCPDVGMWQIFVRWWWICCTTSCRIVVRSPVGGVGPKLHYTDTGYGHVVQHLQLVVSLSVGGVVQHVRSRCPCSGVWHLVAIVGPTSFWRIREAQAPAPYRHVAPKIAEIVPNL